MIYAPSTPYDTAASPTSRRDAIAVTIVARLDATHHPTRHHCQSVASLAARIGSRLGIDRERLALLRRAALMHDVGKVAVPRDILLKSGRLTRDEFVAMQTHSRHGERIVALHGLHAEAAIIRHHHERWDGRGYPDGLAGADIPLASRVIAVADAFDAMTEDRPYRAAGGIADALVELYRNAGTQFDPRCVEALEAALTA